MVNQAGVVLRCKHPRFVLTKREREAMLLFLSVPAMVHGGIINKLNRAPRYYLLVIENNKIFINASNSKDPDR